MAIQVFAEKWDSREVEVGQQSSSARMQYVVTGTESHSEVVDALALYAPRLFYPATGRAGLVRQTVRAKPLGWRVWLGEVQFGDADDDRSQEPPQTGDPPAISFDTTGGTQHLTQSKRTRRSYVDPTLGQLFAPDFQRALNVNGANVEGVDITVPALRFQIQAWQPAALVTLAYVRQLGELTGRTNDALWYGFRAGELLFEGCQGAKRGRGDWEITYHFAYSAHAVNLAIGGITVAEKFGWDYLWVRYTSDVDAAANALVQRPAAAYVEEIYDPADFLLLHLGA